RSPESAPRRRRRRGNSREQDLGIRAAPVVPTHVTRGELLAGYLTQMDTLTAQGVPLSNAVRLTVLFAPLLLTHLDETFAKDPRAGAEEATDALLNPMARRHSLARKDRDRIKRITIVFRRLLSGEITEGSKGRDRLLAREHFREAIVVLWIHLRSLDLDLAPFHYWQAEAKRVPLEESERPRRRGGGGPRRRRRRR
ncbi:MAG: hypothetical protein JKY65_19515, partial [Planctomycetes bacterium]|nr:hypothetical protein [Planctomycetota bacterium]